MSKSEFLKKILVMGLAAISFMTAVGAVSNSDDNFEPPKKVSRIDHANVSEKSSTEIATKKILPKLWDSDGNIRNLVYYMHSIKEIRMAVCNDTDQEPKIDALNSLFRIIEGKDDYNDGIIENAYRILDPDNNGWKNLNSLFEYLVNKYNVVDKNKMYMHSSWYGYVYSWWNDCTYSW